MNFLHPHRRATAPVGRLQPGAYDFHGRFLALFHSRGTAAGQVQFVDVTDGSGVEYSGESYGGAWGDANGDRLPDLFVSHHRNPSGLYVNLADGSFENRGHTIDAWVATPTSRRAWWDVGGL